MSAIIILITITLIVIGSTSGNVIIIDMDVDDSVTVIIMITLDVGDIGVTIMGVVDVMARTITVQTTLTVIGKRIIETLVSFANVEKDSDIDISIEQ